MLARLFSGFFLTRFIIALVVMFVVYNTTGMSYYHWVVGSTFGFGMIVAGVALLGAFTFFIYSTMRAPAKAVYLMILAFVGTLIAWMFVADWVSLSNPTIGTAIAQALVAFALALGSVWGKVWFGTTGQRSVDDPDTGENAH